MIACLQRNHEPGRHDHAHLRTAVCRYTLLYILTSILIAPQWISAEELEPVVKRDPFWPVGYVPRPVDEVEEIDEDEAEWQQEIVGIEWPNLPVRGRSRGPDGAHLVLIDRVGIVRAGDWVRLRSGDYWFHWRITEITEQGVRFIRLGVTNEPDPGEAWLYSQENDPENYEERQP